MRIGFVPHHFVVVGMHSACHVHLSMRVWNKADNTLLKRLDRLHDALGP